MRVRALLLAVGLVLALPARARGEEEKPESRVTIGWMVPGRTVYVGEAVVVSLRVDYDREWLEGRAVAPFAQPLDLPISIDATPFEALPGATLLPIVRRPPLDHVTPTPHPRLALNGVAREADDWSGDRFGSGPLGGPPYVGFRLRFTPSREGVLEVAAPEARFAWSPSFGEDALGQRVPTERREVRVRGPAVRLDVRALPSEGRPPEFVDAIGTFRLSRYVANTTVDVGAPLRLELFIDGVGNLERLTPPRVDALAGLHLNGTTDDHGLFQRRLAHEFVPTRADVQEIPALSLVYFDPSEGAYLVATTKPVPIHVNAVAPTGAEASTSRKERRDESRGRVWPFAGAFVVLIVVIAAARRRARTHAPRPSDDAASVRLRTAFANLNGIRENDVGGLTEAFAEVLAARLRVPRASVIAQDLGPRLEMAGIPHETAEDCARALGALIDARYGAVAVPRGMRDEVVTLSRRIAP